MNKLNAHSYPYEDAKHHANEILKMVGDSWESSIEPVKEVEGRYVGVVYKENVIICLRQHGWYNIAGGENFFESIDDWVEKISVTSNSDLKLGLHSLGHKADMLHADNIYFVAHKSAQGVVKE